MPVVATHLFWMTEILAAVMGGLLTILGGVFQRVIQEWGDVRVRVEGWEVIYPEAITADETRTRHIHVAVPGFTPYIKDVEKYSSITASYSLSVQLFNEKGIGTSLQGLAVVFYRDGGPEIEGQLRAAGTSAPLDPLERIRAHYSPERAADPHRAEEFIAEPSVSVDLPPRQSTTLSVSGEVSGESGREVMKSDRAALKGSFPNGRPFRKEIAVLEETSEQGDKWRTMREEPRKRWQQLLGR
jgi:hypothetical protein